MLQSMYFGNCPNILIHVPFNPHTAYSKPCIINPNQVHFILASSPGPRACTIWPNFELDRDLLHGSCNQQISMKNKAEKSTRQDYGKLFSSLKGKQLRSGPNLNLCLLWKHSLWRMYVWSKLKVLCPAHVFSQLWSMLPFLAKFWSQLYEVNTPPQQCCLHIKFDLDWPAC